MTQEQANKPPLSTQPPANTQTPPANPAAAPAPGAIQAAQPAAPAVDVYQLIEQTRRDTQAQYQAQIQAAQQAAKGHEDALKAAQKDLEKLKVETDKNLSQDEKVQKRLDAMNREIEAAKAEGARLAQEAQAREHASQMNAYRYRKIAEAGPNIISGMVFGNTVEQIDASVEAAKAEFLQLEQNFIQSLAAQGVPITAAGAPQPTPQPMPQPGSYSPHYPAAQPVVHPGYPTPVNAAPPSVAHSLDLQDLRRKTSPEAVRSGEYAKHRAQIFEQLAQGRMPEQIAFGGVPRHLEHLATAEPQPAPFQVSYMPTPNYPAPAQPYPATAPVSPNPYPAQPQAPAAGPAVDPRAAAAAAIARVRPNNPAAAQHAYNRVRTPTPSN